MNTRRRFSGAFTLVELLTVIAIIGILAALLLPVLVLVRKHEQVAQARLEISQIVTAIQNYDSVYGRFPVSTNAQIAAARKGGGGGDFTFGATFKKPGGTLTVENPPIYKYQATNNEVVGILMSLANYPNGTPTANADYIENPQKQIFLNAKLSGYDPASNDPHPPGGVDITGVYRDPWGNPYVISMDLNYDELCEDALYEQNAVSTGGLNGLIPAPDGNYAFRGKVMVWSAGPDGMVSDVDLATAGANKDNIVSW